MPWEVILKNKFSELENIQAKWVMRQFSMTKASELEGQSAKTSVQGNGLQFLHSPASLRDGAVKYQAQLTID